MGHSSLPAVAVPEGRRSDLAGRPRIPARLGIGQALITTGKIDEALEEYVYIASLPKAPAGVLAQLDKKAT